MTTETKRPNILFLMTDQHRHDALGCVNPVIRTPNLDALAARGVRFSEAICNVPMCVPSRYSMMTGLYGFQCGVKHNTQMIVRDEDLPVPVLAQRLHDAGYQTAGFGKTHWYVNATIAPDAQVEASRRGFEVRGIRGAPEPGRCEPESLYMADDEPDAHTRLTEERRGTGQGGESVNGYVGITSAVGPEQHPEGWLTRQALAFLDHGRDPDRPFFLYLSLDDPHAPLFVPPGFEDMYNLEDFPDAPPPEPMPGGHAAGGNFEQVWAEMTPEQRRRSRLRYAALCSYVDHCFGQVLDVLRERGELENTLVVFTADHGDMLGDRGRVSKYCLYDGSIRVPLVIAGPGVEQHGVTDPRPAELVDVVPTLLDAAGVEVQEILPGTSLLSEHTRSGSFAEMHGQGWRHEEHQRAPAVMWRTQEWKLILHLPGRLVDVQGNYDGLEGELYHLSEDPLELNDRYADPACAAIRERLTAQVLMHVMASSGRYPYQPSRIRLR